MWKTSLSGKNGAEVYAEIGGDFDKHTCWVEPSENCDFDKEKLDPVPTQNVDAD